VALERRPVGLADTGDAVTFRTYRTQRAIVRGLWTSVPEPRACVVDQWIAITVRLPREERFEVLRRRDVVAESILGERAVVEKRRDQAQPGQIVTCSGDMYAGEPSCAPVTVSPESPSGGVV